jgi:hypothetical protein
MFFMEEEMTKPNFSDVWNSLVRGVWFDFHPDRNPCEHGNYTSNTDGSACVQCLQNLFDQYPDWDGHGANPVNAESFLRAKSFVMKLPDDVEKPEVVPEPDGEVVMVWTKDGRHVCIVGIEPTGKLIIAVPGDRQMYWPISTKYELYTFLQSVYLENKGEKE